LSNLFLPGLEAEERNFDLSQWFTPPWLADRIWSWWLSDHGGKRDAFRVLEPAAGVGALLRPALRNGSVRPATWAVEIDPEKAAVLRELSVLYPVLSVLEGNFLSLANGGVLDQAWFDLALMNPPYENDRDVAFIRHALLFATDVVGVFRSALVHGAHRFETLWRDVDIVRGVWLKQRPHFGRGEQSTSAQSDFVVLHLVRREVSRQPGERMQTEMEWW
jgi:hypothetical protein